MSLAELPVLVLDCQATSSDSMKGHLLEMAWSEAGRIGSDRLIESRVARLPEGAVIPDRVKRLTGLTEEEISRGEPPEAIFEALSDRVRTIAAASGDGLCPIVIHFAPFEKRYLGRLRLPSKILCTHAIAKRLLPSLPRFGLRAVAGYFGHGVGELRRSAEHVRATAVVWRSLVELLAKDAGIERLEDLLEWLASVSPPRAGRFYPMPSSARIHLPRGPGVYRMLRKNGDVLYVGKAVSLRERVSSYFRESASHGEHILEMLSQARDLETVATPSALEAALLELEEIQRLSPPYNKALRAGRRSLVFTTPDLSRISSSADREHRVGPLPAGRLWSEMAFLIARLSGRRVAGTEELFFADEATFDAGLEIFRSRLKAPSLLAHGAREWLLSSDEREVELELTLQYDEGVPRRATAAEVAEGLNDLVLRASHLVRRSHWLPLLSESTLVWRGRSGERLAILLENGSLASRWNLDVNEPPPEPPGFRLPFLERRKRMDVAVYDRLTVLTREVRRLVREGREVSLHLGPTTRIGRDSLARMLRWI